MRAILPLFSIGLESHRNGIFFDRDVFHTINFSSIEDMKRYSCFSSDQRFVFDNIICSIKKSIYHGLFFVLIENFHSPLI